MFLCSEPTIICLSKQERSDLTDQIAVRNTYYKRWQDS